MWLGTTWLIAYVSTHDKMLIDHNLVLDLVFLKFFVAVRHEAVQGLHYLLPMWLFCICECGFHQKIL